MSSFRSNFTKLASGAVIAQGIALLSSPIVTRLYTPEDYGVLGLYIAISSILIMVSTGRYHLAIVLPKNENEAINLLALSLILVVATATLSSPFLYYFNETITTSLNASELSGFLWLIPVSIIVRGIFISLQYWHTRNKNFGSNSIANITESATGSTSVIVSGLIFGSSVYGLIGSRILSASIASTYLASKANIFKLKDLFHTITLYEIKKVAIYYIKFPLISSWSVLLNTISFSGPVLLLSFFFNPIVVGFYTLADRVVLAPLSIVSNSLSQVIYQKYSETHSSTTEENPLVNNIANKLFTISFYPSVVIAIFGENIFSYAFSTKWADAGIYAQILSLYALSRFIAAPLVNICMVHNKQEIELYFNSILSISRVASIVIGGIYNNIYLGLIFLSLSSALSYGLLLLWIYKLSRCSIFLFIKNCIIVMLSFTPLVLFSLYIKVYNDTFSIIILTIIANSLLYVGIIYKLDSSLLKSIFNRKS